MKKIQWPSTSNPSSISQRAAAAALNGDQSLLAPQRDTFKQPHDFVTGELGRIKGVALSPSDGTFYAFPDMSAVIARAADIDHDIQLEQYLPEHAEVAVIPGNAFGTRSCPLRGRHQHGAAHASHGPRNKSIGLSCRYN